MNSVLTTSRFIIVLGTMLWTFGTAFSQICTDGCAGERCASRGTCESVYETCLANAGGDPDLEALCLQQRTECLTAADDAFVACMSQCPTTEPCAQSAWYGYGSALSFCNDGYYACRYIFLYPPEFCLAELQACQESAYRNFAVGILNSCATSCAVSVAPIGWGGLKSLYRD